LVRSTHRQKEASVISVRREETFDAAEFAARRAKVRALMAERGLDTLLLHSPSNIYYLSGHYTLNLWDYQCLIMPAEGRPVMVLWHFEEGRFAATAVDTDVEFFGGGTSPAQATRDALDRRGWLKGRIGFEKDSPYLPVSTFEKLRDAVSPATAVDGEQIVDLVRMIKSPAELAYIRRAGRATDAAMRAAFGVIGEGVPDSEIAAAIVSELVRQGTQNFAIYPMVAVGARSGVPHNSHDGVAVERGKPVFLEFSPSIRWYQAPLMRAAVVGRAGDMVHRVADVGAAALDAMCGHMKPGVPASEVAEAGRAVVDRIKDIIHFHYYFAYSVGIAFPPTWLESEDFGVKLDNHRPLAEGMVFHFPMTLRIKGEFGVGQSQTVIVTANGCEVLSTLPLGLRSVGG
jgi:Xaa-Pro dipeptidase